MALTLEAAAISAGSTFPVKRRAVRIASSELMGGGEEVIIEHAGEEYRLRITRQQKLILTK